MNQRTRIKICGMNDPTLVDDLVRLGVDAIGLVFVSSSPRFVETDLAIQIARACPPLMTRVALFRNAPLDTIESVLRAVPVDLLQFHGDESNAFCAQFRRPFIRAVGVGNAGSDAHDLDRFPDARTLLLDGHALGEAGGSGTAGDWRQMRQLAESQGLEHWMLAGGLQPENVGLAIEQAAPYAVDVSSGVETAPGVKNLNRIQAFVEAVREADRT